jgi:hypothetical protein
VASSTKTKQGAARAPVLEPLVVAAIDLDQLAAALPPMARLVSPTQTLPTW